MVMDPFISDFISKYPEHQRMLEMCQHESAINNVSRYIGAIEKCDFPMVKPSNSMWSLAKDFTFNMFLPIIGHKGSTTNVDFNPHSSNGVPWQRIVNPATGRHFEDKGEFLNTPTGKSAVASLHVPIFGTTGKIEFLPSEEVKARKMRAFFCGETSLIMKQKLLYDNQDKHMVASATNFKRNWSRYGLVKQYGGINQLAEAHQHFFRNSGKRMLTSMADISGWDKKMPVMHDVYEVRKRLFGQMNDNELMYHNYIDEFVSEPYCCLFNGQIIRRKVGNPSGSGKTTSDNTLGHIMIKFYMYISMFYDKHGHMPEYEQIVDFIILSIYGDDDLSTQCLDDWAPNHITDPEEQKQWYQDYFIRTYLEFGLTVKMSAFTAQFDTISGLEFLGSTFRYNPHWEMFTGEPRWSKIATSVCYILEKDRDITQRISIISAASGMCDFVPGEEATYFKSFLRDYSKYLFTYDLSTIPVNNVTFLSRVADGLHSI